MKRCVSSNSYAVGALLFACLAAISSARAAKPDFHHGEWPFNSPVRPPVPNLSNPAWAANTLDQFVAARLEKAGLHPGPESEKPALLRRVTYDLIGLPCWKKAFPTLTGGVRLGARRLK